MHTHPLAKFNDKGEIQWEKKNISTNFNDKGYISKAEESSWNRRPQRQTPLFRSMQQCRRHNRFSEVTLRMYYSRVQREEERMAAISEDNRLFVRKKTRRKSI